MIPCLKCATRKYGLPSRVHSDRDAKNVGGPKYMNATRGSNRRSHLVGSFVHNQRIVRLQRDTNRCYLSSFITIFHELKDEECLDASDETGLFCLHKTGTRSKTFLRILKRSNFDKNNMSSPFFPKSVLFWH